MKTKGTGIQLNDDTDSDQVWDLKIRLERDESGKILSGIVIGQTMYQNQATILSMYPGEWKFEPRMGVGLKGELLGEDLLRARHKVREDFVKDGMTIKKLDLYNLKKINIEAVYEN